MIKLTIVFAKMKMRNKNIKELAENYLNNKQKRIFLKINRIILELK
jgi:hypothetical protein